MDRDFERIAAHEAGHAVAAWASPRCPAPCLITFDAALGGPSCGIDPWKTPSSAADCLDLAAFFLGGMAGEAVALGDFSAPGGTDLSLALQAAGRYRAMTGAPRRRVPRTPFVLALPSGVFIELRGFLDHAYETAFRRIRRHADGHARLRKLLTEGCASGKLSYDASDIARCLGPRPC